MRARPRLLHRLATLIREGEVQEDASRRAGWQRRVCDGLSVRKAARLVKQGLLYLLQREFLA
jgi:hypothetical protein